MQTRSTLISGSKMELGTFMNNVFAMMSAGLLVTAIVAYTIALNDATMNTLFHTYNMVDASGKTVTKFGASGWWWVAAIAQFLMVIVMSSFGRVGHVPLAVGTPLFLAFAALNGIVLAPALYAYTAVSVAKVFLITSITFSGCAISRAGSTC